MIGVRHRIIDVRRCSIPFNIVTFIKIFVIVYIKVDYFYKNDTLLNTDRTVSNIVYTVSGLVYTVLDGDISMLDAHHTVSNNSKYLILNTKFKYIHLNSVESVCSFVPDFIQKHFLSFCGIFKISLLTFFNFVLFLKSSFTFLSEPMRLGHLRESPRPK